MARCVIQTVLMVVVIGSMMLLTTTHAKTYCVNLIPGAAKLLRGVDVTTLDMVPDDIVLSEVEGKKSPLFTFTCNKSLKYRPFGSTLDKYNRPDQIWHVDTLPGSWSRVDTKIYTSSEDTRKDLNVKVGIKGRYSKYTFSASSSYKNTQNSMTNSSKFVQDVSSYQSTSTIELYPSSNITLNAIFKQEIEKLDGSFETNPKVYRKFIQTFGTHYFKKGIFGGLLVVHQEIDKLYESSSTQKRLDIEAAAAIDNVLSVNVGVSSGNSHGTTAFRQSSMSYVKNYGGNIILLQKNGKEDWQKSVEEDPWLFSGVLSPISDLIIGDDKKKVNLDKAVMDYLLHNYLDELLRLVEAAKLKIHDKILSDLVFKILEMKKESLLQESDVDKLETEVKYQLNLPSWFKNHVKVCKECSESGTACSSFNHKIDKPNDKSCGDIHVYLSAKSGYPDWFGKIQLCNILTIQKVHAFAICPPVLFQKQPQEFRKCVNINTRVTYFTKQLSTLSGCKITLAQSIIVPNTADVPVWAKKFKICFFLEPGCGDDASRIQCFSDGQKLYPSNPDGCILKWGFFTVL